MEEAQQRIDEWVRNDVVDDILDLSLLKLGLTILPSLPANLQRLYCDGNRLTELPPASCEFTIFKL